MNDGFGNLTDWHLGLTTLAPTTTNPNTNGPTTQFVPTVKAELDLAEVDDTIPITSADIDSLFALIQSEFGCGSYSDDADRILVPNVIMFVSDNFGSYANFWNKFAAETANGWSCSDCPGTPAYVFLSATNDVAPVGLGVSYRDLLRRRLPTSLMYCFQTTYSINDAEYFDLATSMKAVNNFNAIVNGICTSPLKSCCTYKVPSSCQRI
ncbi:hypothetical protein OESDEN_15359 [Oesophagostomum dentatum]|uniref:Uncharacterized protein n=1 Tax=Oesophagostomum dentatum TaxID=61180 RepID=A0A0B1SN16_OESDE|nr:hypothetical protein OESDEN_15359 [Oesophagostomum dentatum]